MTKEKAKIRISDNIDYLSKEKERISTIADAQMYELAGLSVNNAPYEAVQMFSEVTGKTYDTREFALFCKYYSELAGKDDISEFVAQSITENDDFTESQGVACMKNKYSEKALAVFSDIISGETVIDVSSFSESCELVSYGKAKYCILPYSNSADGVLLTLRRLIRKYDLKIISAADITADDGESVTRFALLSREINPKTGDSELLEVSSPIKLGEQTSRLFSAADELGVTVSQIMMEPLLYSDEESHLSVLLKLNNCNIYAVFMFLFYALPRHDLIGLYKTAGKS